MFGSISNWINTNLPQVTVPPVNLPNLPNMPKMPEIFGMNKNTDETSSAAASNSQQATNSTKSDELIRNGEENSKNINDQDDIKNNFEIINSQSLEKSEQALNKNENADQTANINESSENKPSLNPLDIDAQKALDTAKEIGSNFGNMLFSFGKNASTNVFKHASHLKDVIEKKTIIGEFSKENEKFINDKKSQQRKEESAVPPWVGYNEEEIMKEQIMALSLDSRNFCKSPPDGVEFNFDYNVAYPTAMATLEVDPNLKDMRFKLVPKKVTEETFWRNYFYRVSLIKQSTQLDQLNSESQNFKSIDSDQGSNSKSETAISNHNISNVESLTGNEFVSDSYDPDAINDEELKSELKQLNLDSKKGNDLEDTEWDKELAEDLDSISAEELEKEINQMIEGK